MPRCGIRSALVLLVVVLSSIGCDQTTGDTSAAIGSACVVGTDCAGAENGFVCPNGSCVPCKQDQNCAAYSTEHVCKAGRCELPDETVCFGEDGCACYANGTCDVGLTCDQLTLTCSPTPDCDSLDCPCNDTDDPCDAGLKCEAGTCIVCPAGSLGCECATDDVCATNLKCNAGTCEACTWGESGCPCFANDSCFSPLICTDGTCGACVAGTEGCVCSSQGDACVTNDLKCAAATNTCTSCIGEVGCPCYDNQTCDNETQNQCDLNTNTCMECPDGHADCPCSSDGTCDPCVEDDCETGLVCDPTTHTCDTCVFGELGCACITACTDGSKCTAGLCVECSAGTAGCPCAEGNVCESGFGCLPDENGVTSCQPCTDGEFGCACIAGTGCGDGLTCNALGLCVTAGCAGDVGCACLVDGTCNPGNVCDADKGTCLVCTNTVAGCPCVDGACGTGLACLQGICQDCDGAAGCTCTEPGDCGPTTAKCEDGQCVACNLATVGCACDTGECVPGLLCNNTTGLCDACPEGQAGCACPVNGLCNEGQTCNLQSSACENCTNGKLQCMCADGACDEGLTCDSATNKCIACEPGLQGCPCSVDDAGASVCGTDLVCNADNKCESCATGSDGCPCGASNNCDDGLECVIATQTCKACEPGSGGCPCVDTEVTADKCEVGLSCSVDNICALGGEGGFEVCGSSTQPVFNGALGVCAACNGGCQGPGLTGLAWPSPALSTGTCFCETVDNYHFDPAGSVTAPCDADGDGWLRISAKTVELYTNPDDYPDFYDPAVEANFRCDVRSIDRFVLVPDSAPGVQQTVWLNKAIAKLGKPETVQDIDSNLGFFVGSVTLYESNRNDEQSLLEERLTALYGENGKLPTADGGARFPFAAELNPLTKLCVNATADFNDNDTPDIDDVGQGSDALFTRFAYFAELHRGYFVADDVDPITGVTRGAYYIREKRRATDADVGDQVAVTLETPPAPVCQETPTSPTDLEYWRECARRPDSTYDPELALQGLDFAEWSFNGPEKREPFYPGMGHHSQFKCVKRVVEGSEELSPTKTHVVTGDAFGQSDGKFVANTCVYEGLPGDVAPPLGAFIDGTNNPSDPGHSCTVSSAPNAGDVTWSAVTFTGYVTAGGYTRGCVDECGELRSIQVLPSDIPGVGTLASPGLLSADFKDTTYAANALDDSVAYLTSGGYQCLDSVPLDANLCCSTDRRNFGHASCPASVLYDADGDGAQDPACVGIPNIVGGYLTHLQPHAPYGGVRVVQARLQHAPDSHACVGDVCLQVTRFVLGPTAQDL